MRPVQYISLLLLAALAYVSTGFLDQGGRKNALGKASTKVVSFKKDVMPVFKKYCLPCHTEDQMNPSELYLESYEDLMKGGKHGTPVLPGKPDSSLMVQKLGPNPPFGDKMPYKAKSPLPADTFNILKQWIAQGAKND